MGFTWQSQNQPRRPYRARHRRRPQHHGDALAVIGLAVVLWAVAIASGLAGR